MAAFERLDIMSVLPKSKTKKKRDLRSFDGRLTSGAETGALRVSSHVPASH